MTPQNPDVNFKIEVLSVDSLKNTINEVFDVVAGEDNDDMAFIPIRMIMDSIDLNIERLDKCKSRNPQLTVFESRLLNLCLSLNKYICDLCEYYSIAHINQDDPIIPKFKLRKAYNIILNNLAVLHEHYQTLEKLQLVELSLTEDLDGLIDDAFLSATTSEI